MSSREITTDSLTEMLAILLKQANEAEELKSSAKHSTEPLPLSKMLLIMHKQAQEAEERKKSAKHSIELSSLEDRVRALEAQLSTQVAEVQNSLKSIKGSLATMAEATRQNTIENGRFLAGINDSLVAMAGPANRSNAE
jgi:uncharacterized protein YlxW (UPF0749 family)